MKGKTSALVLIAVFLITGAALTAIELIIPVKANAIPLPERLATEHGYIRSNGTIDPPTLPIQRDGNIYRLTADILNYTFEVECDNVVIDGNGFLLSAPAHGEKGKDGQTKMAYPLISISNRSSIIVKNVSFNKCSRAIYIENSSNIIIFQNTIRNGTTGIYMIRSANCSLVGNYISDNAFYGVLIQDSTSLNISYNKIANQDRGVTVQDLTRSIFNGLQCSNITRNDFTDNRYVGLELSGPHSNNQIFENNFIDNGVGLLYTVYGLTLNNTIYNNYWSNQRLQIEICGDAKSSIDESPLSSPISTVFDPSVFTLPSFSTPEPEPEPFQTVSAVTGITAVALVGIGVLIYFKKRKH